MKLPILLILLLTSLTHAQTLPAVNSTKAEGYRGIWFTLGQVTKYGDKYSGGLGTYPANHRPISIYSPKVNKTFFVYGGTTKKEERHLLIMASVYDHATGMVPRPTIVHDKEGVNDPHDNGAISLDADGYVWVFISGRARARPGFVYRSTAPYSVDAFEKIDQRELTYPQPHFIPGEGFLHLFTRYTAGRELYWETSFDGRAWEPAKKLVGFGGHYQVSGQVSGQVNGRQGKTIGTSFMWHPGGNVDKRTNLYYMQTSDFGKTWTTADGRELKTPLNSEKNDALIIDYQAQGMNVYIHDLNFDEKGRPVILYLTSHGAAPGPDSGKRIWRITRWDGQAWLTRDVCESDHNYDTGSLWIDGDHWFIIGPTDPGPQPPGTGGEMVRWVSDDAGETWKRDISITQSSQFNHSYARRTIDGKDPFSVFWADGDPNRLSESHLYFGSADGKQCFVLPYDMSGDTAQPKPCFETKP